MWPLPDLQMAILQFRTFFFSKFTQPVLEGGKHNYQVCRVSAPQSGQWRHKSVSMHYDYPCQCLEISSPCLKSNLLPLPCVSLPYTLLGGLLTRLDFYHSSVEFALKLPITTVLSSTIMQLGAFKSGHGEYYGCPYSLGLLNQHRFQAYRCQRQASATR
jgi:hypothetical protein